MPAAELPMTDEMKTLTVELDKRREARDKAQESVNEVENKLVAMMQTQSIINKLTEAEFEALGLNVVNGSITQKAPGVQYMAIKMTIDNQAAIVCLSAIVDKLKCGSW